MVRYLLRWLLLSVCWYCKCWIKFALGRGIVGVIRWVILFLHILHRRTDIYSMHDYKSNNVDAYLDMEWYRIFLGQPPLSSAFGHFLTGVNYQNMAIAAPATFSPDGHVLPGRSHVAIRGDPGQMQRKSASSCNRPSRDRYGFTFDLCSPGLYLANMSGPRCRHHNRHDE